eukprot:TRINITY_DN8619_c0_g1_i1.p1 TRINITY_DN8619_c0_g1~~TRINITY_DN8619_c0_g1_i1.p1  ORF type:complete len:298 (+),score=75.06 TRINITY_DN8619_c0_g1_i1:64-957(+)
MSDTKSAGATARFFCSSTAACVAEIFTFPIDTTRVRMQVQREAAHTRLGMLGTARNVWHTQGTTAFYKGIPPAMLRQFVQCGVNLSLYLPIRNALGADRDHSVWKKGMAGAASGASGALCAVPTDVVKVRMQADVRQTLQGGTPRYTSTANAFKTIYQEGGAKALYRGTVPTCGRSAALHASGLASYDGFKNVLVKRGGMRAEDSKAHLLASAFSGAMSSAFGCPFDVIKTRVMNHVDADKGTVTPARVLRETVRSDGARALFSGFIPTLMRLGPWQVMWLCVYERLCIVWTGQSKF